MLHGFAFKRHTILLGVCVLFLGIMVPLASFAKTSIGEERTAPSSFSGSAHLFGDARLVEPGNHSTHAVQLRSSGTVAPGYGGIDFKIPPGVTFAKLLKLSTDYNFTHNSCGGGSPRFSVTLDTDNDGGRVDSSDGNIVILLGPSPDFTNCPSGWQNTGNYIGNNDAGRYDTSHVPGGTPYTTYSSALALAGSYKVLDISLIVDGSFFFSDGVQTVLVDNIVINNSTYRF